MDQSSEPSVANRLLLLDGHAYAYRAFHAIRSLSSPSGRPTNALFGFIKMTQKLLARHRPSHFLVTWDGGLAEERTQMLPGYKAQRPPTPEDLAEQFPQIQDWLTLAGYAQIQVEGTEADDWIGTYTLRSIRAGLPVLIASSDKDFLQLVSQQVGIVQPNDKSEKVWTPADVVARTGVQPEQIVDWLALIGDSVDNIPGVSGVGPKTAADLLSRFGSLDGIYERLTEVSAQTLQSKLLAARDQMRQNQTLIRLKTDLQNGPDLETLRPRPQQLDDLAVFYQQRGFRSLHAEVLATQQAARPSERQQTFL